MADKKFVCNINVSDRYRKFVAAGTPFVKELLVTHTFETLQRQGHISVYDVTAPIAVIKGSKGKMLASIPATTPAAAIHPPTLTEDQKIENAKLAAIDSKRAKVAVAEKNAAKEVVKVDNAEAVLAEEEEAKIVLDAVAAEEAEDAKPEAPAEEKPESTVELVWTADPEEIKDLKYEQLNSVYRTQCEKYKLPLEQFNSKKLLIAKLSSEFKA